MAHLTIEEVQLIVMALNSYIRRKYRDYRNKVNQGAEVERLQERQAFIQRLVELQEKIVLMETLKNGWFESSNTNR